MSNSIDAGITTERTPVSHTPNGTGVEREATAPRDHDSVSGHPADQRAARAELDGYQNSDPAEPQKSEYADDIAPRFPIGDKIEWGW